MKSIKRIVMAAVLTLASISTFLFTAGKAQAIQPLWDAATVVVGHSLNENNTGRSISCPLFDAATGKDFHGTLNVEVDANNIAHASYTLSHGSLTLGAPLETTFSVSQDFIDGRKYVVTTTKYDVQNATGDYQGITTVMCRCKYLVNDSAIPGSDEVSMNSITDLRACHECVCLFIRD